MKDFTLLLFCLLLLDSSAFSNATDTIDTLQSISDGETLVSPNGIFKLGFFSPATSKKHYVGIWYDKVPNLTVVWVANRDTPLNDSSGVLKINDAGIIVLLNHNDSVIWSTPNITKAAKSPVAMLLNSGNFIVRDKSNSGREDFLWQSFDYPCDTLLAGQKLGTNLITRKNRHVTSWNSPDDPSPGIYTVQVDVDGYPQLVMRDGNLKRLRTGSWNGNQCSGTPQLKPNPIFKSSFVINEKEAYYSYELFDDSIIHRDVLTPDGFIHISTWIEQEKKWNIFSLPADNCDYYATCGAFASCNIHNIPLCSCLDGFVKNKTYSSSDCFRRTPLSCNGDGFLKVPGLKLPDTGRSWFNRSMSLEDCKVLCMNNCSCTAYASLDISKGGSGCLIWFGNLIDMRVITPSLQDIYIRMARTELEAIEGRKSHRSRIQKQRTIIISCVLSLVLILSLAFIIYRWKLWQKEKMKDNLERETRTINDNSVGDLELPLFDMSAITFATNNFSIDNILGKGGFGSVYKGILEDGREIAIKRLSKNSSQGLQEFKNEVMHVVKLQHKNLVKLLGCCIQAEERLLGILEDGREIAIKRLSKNSSQGLQEFKNEVMHVVKLQHKNLVKLLGCCIQAEERLLVYEFMPNKSLDLFIFDEKKGMLLDWPRRLHIINGIARGLLYLHQDSRHKIVHRDLKAANILLDDKMNPKISDFGLARSFSENQSKANTQHVAGTYGYLPPEYIIDGDYSTKSDIFSFGVLVLEIISGKRNRGFYHQDHHFNLLGHVWRLFTEGKGSEIVYTTEGDTSNLFSMLRSIHIGLLCVQWSPDDRPSMSSVVLLLSSESPLPQPKTPGFFIEREMARDHSSSSSSKPGSINDVSISQLEAR